MKKKDTLLSVKLRLFLLLSVQCCILASYAQIKTRTYANFQGTYFTTAYVAGIGLPYGTVLSAGNAVDGNPRTADTLSVPVAALGLISATQFQEFTTAGTNATARTIAANTPVTVKIGLPSSALNLLSGIEVGTFSNLSTVAATTITPLYTGAANQAGYTASTMNAAYTGTALLSALNGSGQVEITLHPTTSYQGVYVKLTGNGLAVALNAYIYDAYIMENATPPVACNSRIDVLYGVRSNSLANLLTATGSVTNPYNAIDTDPTISTFNLMTAGVQVLSGVFQTVVFNTASKIGDSVCIYLQEPGAGLLDATVLSGLTITPYNRDTARNAIAVNSPLLNLRLLSGSNNIYRITAAVKDGVFDRVDIYMGGAVSALSNLRVYDVSRIIPKPAVTGTPVAVMKDTIKVYPGQNVTLTATPVSATDGVNWYNNANTLITSTTTGASQISLTNVQAANQGNYVSVVTRNGCTETSARDTTYLKVLAVSFNPTTLPSGNRNSPYSQKLKLTGDTDLAPFTYSITSGSLPATLTLSPSTGIISGTPTVMGTFVFDAQAADSNGNVAATNTYSLVINAALPITLVSFNAVKGNNGGVVLNWTTADALNFLRFEVQRSSDGIHFSTIGSVDYTGASSYTYTDNAANNGINHYRLKLVDIDGRFENSLIRSIAIGRSAAIEIFPNPVSSIITVSTGSQLQGRVTIQVTDLAGRILKQEQKTATVGGTLAVDANKLLNGIYILNVINENGQRVFSGQVLVRH